jgi:hypothetical protein
MMSTFPNSLQHVLVTGGTGFVGQAVIKELLAKGYQVTVLSRSTQKVVKLWQDKVAGVSDLDTFQPSTPISAIINLAGARILGKPWTLHQRQVLKKSRILLTEKVVQWVEKQTIKPKVLLSASAIGYYGIQPQGDQTALTEASLPQPIFMSELCQEWEQAAFQAAKQGVKVATMRFGLVMGKGGALPMMLLPVRLGVGGRMGTGKQWLSWIHINDLVNAMGHVWQQLLANDTAPSTYNFTAPEVVTQQEFVQTAAKILHRPAFIPTPALPVKLLLGEQADLLLEGQKVIPKALVATGFEFQYPNVHQALEQIIRQAKV